MRRGLLVVVLLATLAACGGPERAGVTVPDGLAPAFRDLATRFDATQDDLEVAIDDDADIRLEFVPVAQADDDSVVATDELVLALPRANPGGLLAVDDLDRPAVRYAVPAGGTVGRDAAALLRDAGIDTLAALRPDDTASVIEALTGGEVVAGIAYASEVAAASGLVALPLPGSAPRARALVAEGAGADAFLTYLHSPDATKILTTAGLTPA